MNEPPLGADATMGSALFDRESIEVGEDRIRIFVGKFDLRHRPMLANHAFLEFSLQFLWGKPGVDIAHRRSFLKRTGTCGLDRVAAATVLLKDDLAPGFELAGIGGM